MNAPVKIEAHPLNGLRAAFPPHQVSKLPKETRAQIDARKADRNLMVWKCEECGGAHHKNAVHLDYVGHAALTDRLLDVDICWSWEPLAFGPDGLPALDRNGGLWIKLTVQGVTRLGYGGADGKQGTDAIKEIIGDALRNAAMRFGAALDLWHKGDLHLDADEIAGGHSQGDAQGEVSPQQPEPEPKKAKNWGGRYPTMTALKQAMHTHHAELERMGIESVMDDLDGYLTSPEYLDYIAAASEHAPYYLEGERHPNSPPEFIQTFTLEQKARDMIALRGNVPADMENN
tara:strand:+ start:25 stop:888 length:864 start_codon:yes stop_codon:yes gene_type:complete